MMIYYKENGVARLEPMKWVRVVKKAGLLHMFCTPHFHMSIMNTLCVRQLLMLVHDGCLWPREPIPIIDMLIHRITNPIYKGADLAKEFGGKSGERELVDKMKVEFGLIKNSCRYYIRTIQD